MTTEARGYLVMAVREARLSRASLESGDAFTALNRLAWAWRFLANAESGLVGGWGTSAGSACSYARTCAALDAVRDDFVRCWPRRVAGMKRDMRDAAGRP